MLIMTCGVAIWRRRIISCPFCNERMSDFDLRTHIQQCNQHNVLYMGRFNLTEALAIPVPLPPSTAPASVMKVVEL
jgi:hypothetical protein